MRKRILRVSAVLLCLALLSGCKLLTQTNIDFDADSISKAQKIVIRNADGEEKGVLTGEEEVEAFVDAMNLGGWRLQELPEGLAEAGGFTLWQQETVAALTGGSSSGMAELCTLRVYADGDYLVIETGLADVPFAIPRETADYLRSLLA